MGESCQLAGPSQVHSCLSKSADRMRTRKLRQADTLVDCCHVSWLVHHYITAVCLGISHLFIFISWSHSTAGPQSDISGHSCRLLSRQLTGPPPQLFVYQLIAFGRGTSDKRSLLVLVDCYGGRKGQQLVNCPAAVGASVERAQRRRCAR